MADAVDAFLDGYQVPVEEVPICSDATLVDRFAAVDRRLNAMEAEAGLGGAPDELYAEVDRLKAEVEASVTVFRLKALPFSEWVALQGEHPPSEDEKAQGNVTSPVTWEPAVISACAVEPTMTVDQAKRMRDVVAATEWAQMLDAITRLHQGGPGPKSRLLSVLRRASAVSSASQPGTGSLADPSSGDDGEQ